MTRAYSIARPDTAFGAPRQKRPRQKTDAHLRFIRSLPCCIPGCKKQDIHAAHIRTANPRLGKRETGKSEKPDDSWTLPLCGDHHVFGSGAQHTMNELEFYRKHGIEPFTLALSLWRVSGDEESALLILREAKEQA